MAGQDFQYRKLIVWQKAMQFSKQVYRLIDESLEEIDFGICGVRDGCGCCCRCAAGVD